jgi:hypothetical protein
MNAQPTTTPSTALSIASGTMLTVAVNISQTDLLKTVLLAIVGACTSFLASLALKWLMKRLKR